MTGWLDRRVLEPATSWSLRREARGVTEGLAGAQRSFYWMMLRWVLILVGVFVWPHTSGWMQDILFGLMLLFLVTGALSGWNRQLAYKRGWQEGRRRMADHFPAECRHVDARVENWLDAERNFDAVHIMGLPPSPPPR